MPIADGHQIHCLWSIIMVICIRCIVEMKFKIVITYVKSEINIILLGFPPRHLQGLEMHCLFRYPVQNGRGVRLIHFFVFKKIPDFLAPISRYGYYDGKRGVY